MLCKVRLLCLPAHGSCVLTRTPILTTNMENQMPNLQPQRWRSTVVFADGRRIDVDEPLPLQTIVADAKRAGATKVELENGTEIFFNENGEQR